MMPSGAQGSTPVTQVLAAARRLTGMQAGYLAEFAAGQQVLREVDDPDGAFSLAEGDESRLEDTFCQRVVDGRLERVVPDAEHNEVTEHLPGTTRAGIRGYLGVPVRYPDGRLYGSLCCIDHRPCPDIRERDADLLDALASLLGHHLAAEGRVEQVTRERDELLASVSHDLRTPLMAMRFLGEDLEQAEQIDRRAAGAQIQQESGRVLTMVEDLMLITRHRAGSASLQLEMSDLAELVREAADRARRAHSDGGGAVALELPDAPLLAPVDPNRLLRALDNLLDNGLKYSPDGGPVVVTLHDEGPTAVISVADEGMGIAHDELDCLGERFWRSPRAVAAGVVGLGLGLTSVQAVADLHEGTLSVQSELGAGSRFELRLPTRPALQR